MIARKKHKKMAAQLSIFGIFQKEFLLAHIFFVRFENIKKNCSQSQIFPWNALKSDAFVCVISPSSPSPLKSLGEKSPVRR